MKIYRRVVFSMDTGETVEEESFEYDGPVALCGGGGSEIVSVDYEYNKRMAAISERQQGMAESYFKFWENEYKPLESAQIKANMELLPQQTKLEKLKMASEEELLPVATEYQKGLMQANLEQIEMGKPVMAEYYKQALQGQDADQKVQEARVDVASAFKDQEGALRRQAGRMGLDPNSGRFADALGAGGLNQARATAGAMTKARDTAEKENFGRLQNASQIYKAGLPK